MSRRGSLVRWALILVVALYFVVPMLAMARFSFQAVPVIRLGWGTLLDRWSLGGLEQALSEPTFRSSTWTSTKITALTILVDLALLLPLAITVELHAPRLRGPLTAVTLLPWVVPPIALVVGIAATFRSLAPWFLASPLSLVPFYALSAMPFTYRALDAGLRAIGARTLHEAARSLGAGMPTVIVRVLVPNLGASIVAAAMLTGAFVLGEFTFAALLLKTTLPTYMADYQRDEPRPGMALALAVMVLTALALALAARLLRRRGLELSSAGGA